LPQCPKRQEWRCSGIGGFKVKTAAFMATALSGLSGGHSRDLLRRFAHGLRSLTAPKLPKLPARLAPILVALLMCALLAASLGIIGGAAQEILRSQAETTAREWADYLTVNVPDLRAIVAGRPPSTRSAIMFDRAHGSGNLFLIEVLDIDGNSRFISQSRDSVLINSNEGPKERQIAIQSARHGMLALMSRRGETAREPAYFADALVPVMDGKTAIGLLRIYIDMSRNYHALVGILTGAAIWIGLVLAVAFGIPGAGYWLRTRQKEKAEVQLQFLSEHDALTQLANRGALIARLEQVLRAPAQEPPNKLAVLCMDLDHFKDVNDALGHAAGDLLLKEVAVRLQQLLEPNERVARAGGDEFILLQEGITSRDAAAGLAKRLLGAFSRPFTIGGHTMRIGPSIGVAIGPDDGTDAQAIVKCADIALHVVKSGGRGTFRFFEGSMDQLQQRRLHVAEQVRRACETGGFRLNFQPVFSLGTGLLAGFEALVRLPCSDGSIISPAEFVPVAEELGLVTKIGAFVLETACEQAALWPSDLTVAVNISPDEFRAGDVVERVAAALAKTGLDPERLEIEVTEGVLLADSDTTRKTIDGLKKLGVAIVLDDFGTGYSSLSYLWQFRFDKIKIDQSFVKAIGKNENVSDIIRTIVALGRALDLRVTAEGVETEAQAAVLRAMRCDLVQGYLYGKPVAQPDVPAFVARPLPESLAAKSRRDSELQLVSI
jgi:diguanylate cyclase (GGDEF)-like protein